MTKEEAIEVYNGLINTKIKEAFEFFAPELAESEDERVRKEILDYIKTGTYQKKWIEWLEKQGDQKFADNIESSLFRDKLLELFQRFRWYCKDETPTNGDVIEYVDAHIQELIDTTQKPTEWSEEDEDRINRLIAYFEDKESFTAEDDIVYANWLKSLRPQNMWKPSEEQIKALDDAIYHVDDNIATQIAKLIGDLRKLMV